VEVAPAARAGPAETGDREAVKGLRAEVRAEKAAEFRKKGRARGKR
jgi:hypothetical protein